jgi:hypothetical protein
MALRRRAPGGGAPGQDELITGESQIPGVRDTKVGLGGLPEGGGDDVLPPANPGGGGKSGNDMPDTHFGRFGETPRERTPGVHGGPPPLGPQATPPSPTEPIPMSGQPGGGMTPPPPPMEPFDPMASDPNAFISPAGAGPARRSLFGSMGGLKGGGLGVPLDPVSNESSDPIQGLIQALLQKRGGGASGGGGFGSF